MKTSFKVIVSFLLAGTILTGCTPNNRTSEKEKNEGAMNIAPAIAKELERPTYGEEDVAVAAVTNGANEFAFKLSAALVKQADNENFVCSPYSVWIPLAALINATNEQSKPALLEALNVSGINNEEINIVASRMLYQLTKQEERKFAEEHGQQYHNPLKIINAVFVDNKMTLKKDFVQTYIDYYRGSSINVDFSSSEAVDAVNKWASENTEGLIKDIVQEFDPAAIAAIANAIYFSDRWSQEFDPTNTNEDVFHSPDAETKAFYMLREGSGQTYYEDDRVQAMPITFKTGGGMYIILPKDGDAVSLLSSMTSDYFDKIHKDSVSATGKLLLPRFSIESDVMQLKDALTALGVPLFDKDAAPLTGGLVAEKNMPIYLSSAMHKAVIKVDEKGTTAAAVTIVEAVAAGILEPTEPFEMNCNKPFVFILYGHRYDGGSQILFTGVVNQP